MGEVFTPREFREFSYPRARTGKRFQSYTKAGFLHGKAAHYKGRKVLHGRVMVHQLCHLAFYRPGEKGSSGGSVFRACHESTGHKRTKRWHTTEWDLTQVV